MELSYSVTGFEDFFCCKNVNSLQIHFQIQYNSIIILADFFFVETDNLILNIYEYANIQDLTRQS